MGITLGQVVYSKAGRDSGKRFVVIEVLNESYVMISDGDLRRIEKPKKKKVKHLEFTGDILDDLNRKLEGRLKVTNADIRKSLAALLEKVQDTGDK